MISNTRFLIYTEDVNRAKVQDLINQHFDAATLHVGSQGIWRGITENSLIIEVIGAAEHTVQELARRIKEVNKQEAVLITREEIQAELV